jgi:hypothetical protein
MPPKKKTPASPKKQPKKATTPKRGPRQAGGTYEQVASACAICDGIKALDLEKYIKCREINCGNAGKRNANAIRAQQNAASKLAY